MNRFTLAMFTSVVVSVTALVGGCGTAPPEAANTLYSTSYHPMSPLTVAQQDGIGVSDVLAFPQNEQGQYSIQELTSDDSVSFAGNQVSGSGMNAEIVTDFLKYRSATIPMLITRERLQPQVIEGAQKPKRASLSWRYHVYKDGAERQKAEADGKPTDLVFEGSVPVYIGIGVRVVATVSNVSASVNLTSLAAVSAAATAGQIRGTIAVGTMGITGDNIGILIQQPVGLNDATIQTANEAVGAIKTSLASADPSKFHVSLQVMGFEFDSNDKDLVSTIKQYIVDSQFGMIRCNDGYTVEPISKKSKTGTTTTTQPSSAPTSRPH